MTHEAPETRRPAPVSDEDGKVLTFIAAHRLVLAGHVQTLLNTSEQVAADRLAALQAAGHVTHRRVLYSQPPCYQITGSGLAALGSTLPPPRLDLSCYRHDIGVAWIWLASTRRAFGRVDRVVSEREMRSLDSALTRRHPGSAGEAPFGIQLAGVGLGERVELHYPDICLIGGPHRVALELQFASPGRRARETTLAAYGADPSVAAVIYLSDDPAVHRLIIDAAARLGLSRLVHVRRASFPQPTTTTTQ